MHYRTRFARLLVVIALAASSGLVFAGPFDDCQEYVKLGVPGKDGDPLCRKGYALAHNPETKTPYWVAEHLTKKKASAVLKRSGTFKADPELEVGFRAEKEDYQGYPYDTGHMAPSANMQWDKVAMTETFLYSNAAPQDSGMNRGIWSALEGKIRRWAKSRGELYIYTGPIYEGDPMTVIGTNQVGVPSHFFKVIYDPLNVEAIAFIMPNEKLVTAEMSSHIKSVREVEERTKLNFLSKLKKSVQDAVEMVKAEGLWE